MDLIKALNENEIKLCNIETYVRKKLNDAEIFMLERVNGMVDCGYETNYYVINGLERVCMKFYLFIVLNICLC